MLVKFQGRGYCCELRLTGIDDARCCAVGVMQVLFAERSKQDTMRYVSDQAMGMDIVWVEFVGKV